MASSSNSDRKYHGLRALSGLVSRSAAAALRKRGLGQTEIVTRWTEIVGPVLARESIPEKLVFRQGKRSGGALHIRAPGPLAVELQHLEPVLLERINTYFGYRAVEEIRLIHGAVSRDEKEAKAPPAQPLEDTEISDIESRTGKIQDPALREALQALGKSVKSAENSRKNKNQHR